MDKKAFKTMFIDVMLYGRYVFTLRYMYCPLFMLDFDDIEAKVLEKRPTLKGKPFHLVMG